MYRTVRAATDLLTHPLKLNTSATGSLLAWAVKQIMNMARRISFYFWPARQFKR
jgi:spore cortex formation protein SpoVR/YcgB (stage V sporulation)